MHVTLVEINVHEDKIDEFIEGIFTSTNIILTKNCCKLIIFF